MSSKIHVMVTGNIGSGKTYAIDHAKWIHDDDVYVMKEFIDYDPSLASKLEDKLNGKMSYIQFELSVVLQAYLDQIKTDEYNKARIIVWDQAPETIVDVFIHFYNESFRYENENIPKIDSSYALIDAKTFMNVKPKMNSFVYLDESIDQLMQNIASRGRSCDKYTREDIEKYQQLFDAWFYTIKIQLNVDQKYFIVLEGPPGAGKTTFINHIPMKDKYVIKEFTEYLPDGFEKLNKYLNKELDYVDFQLNVVLKSFISQVKSPEYQKSRVIIWDRSIYSIIDQFSYIALKRNNIEQWQYNVISEGVLHAVEQSIRCYPIFEKIVLSGGKTSDEAVKLFSESIDHSYIVRLKQDNDLLRTRIMNRGNQFEIQEYDEKYNSMFETCVEQTIKRFSDKYYFIN